MFLAKISPNFLRILLKTAEIKLHYYKYLPCCHLGNLQACLIALVILTGKTTKYLMVHKNPVGLHSLKSMFAIRSESTPSIVHTSYATTNDSEPTFLNEVPFDSFADVDKVKGFYTRVVLGISSFVVYEERVPMDASIC